MILKRISAVAYWCAVALILTSVAFSAEEYRKLGVEDLEIATGGTGSAETATSTGGVTSTKIDATHVMLRAGAAGTSVEASLSEKQPLDADLTTLAAPTAWRFVYSGASGYAQLAFGAAGLCLQSGGASAAPVWAACGTGGGGTTTLPWDNITDTGGVTTTELGYVHGITSSAQTQFNSLQSQVNAKQALDADLTVLSYPTNWRMFYSNGSHAITELAFGTSGYVLQSNGASAAPSWIPNTAISLNNTTMDNTVITNSPISGSTGSFTTLEVGAVSNAEFALLNGMDNNIKTTFDLKAPKASPAFTGNATFDNEVTAVQFNSTGADNTHFINVANTGAPSGPTKGDCYYDNTLLGFYCYNGSSWIGSAPTDSPTFTTFVKIPQGTGPTVDAAGKIAVDTTADQLIYYGSALQVVDPIHQLTYTDYGAFAGDNVILTYMDRAVTITKVACVVEGAIATATWHIYHSSSRTDGTGGNALVTAATSCNSTTTAVVTTSFNDATIPAGSWVYAYVDAITADHISWTIYWTVDRQ